MVFTLIHSTPAQPMSSNTISLQVCLVLCRCFLRSSGHGSVPQVNITSLLSHFSKHFDDEPREYSGSRESSGKSVCDYVGLLFCRQYLRLKSYLESTICSLPSTIIPSFPPFRVQSFKQVSNLANIPLSSHYQFQYGHIETQN